MSGCCQFSALHRAAALAVGLMLAGPRGWCCGWRMAEVAAPQAIARCCGAKQPARPAHPATWPETRCCCNWVGGLQDQSSTRFDSPVLVAFLANGPAFLHHDALSIRVAAVHPHRVGPRLHLLQCVWRC